MVAPTLYANVERHKTAIVVIVKSAQQQLGKVCIVSYLEER